MTTQRTWSVAGHLPLIVLTFIAIASMVHACSAGSSGGGYYYYPTTN